MPTTSPLDIPAIDLPAPGPRSARTILSSSAHVPPGRTRTLRVGRDAASRARFYLDSPAEMALLLDRLRARLDAAGGARHL